MTPWAAGTSSTTVPPTEFPLLRPCFLHRLAHAFSHPVRLLRPVFMSSELRFPSRCAKDAGAHPACWVSSEAALNLGRGCWSQTSTSTGPVCSWRLQQDMGVPSFFYPLLLFRYHLDKVVVGPSRVWQLAACTGPPPGRVRGHRGKCSNVCLLILLKMRKSI